MKLALEKGSEAEVIVLNGDTYIDVDLLDLMREFDSAGVDLAVAVTYMNTVARYGAIDEKSNTITGFDNKKACCRRLDDQAPKGPGNCQTHMNASLGSVQ